MEITTIEELTSPIPEKYIILRNNNPDARIRINNNLYKFAKITLMQSNDKINEAEGISKTNVVSGVYFIVDYKDNKFYIGGSTNIYGRLARHRRAINKGNNHVKELNKKEEGWNRLQIILIYTESKDPFVEEMKLLETYWSDPRLLNKAKGATSSEIIKSLWEQPECRKIFTENAIASSNSPERKEFTRTQSNKRWATPGYKEKLAALSRDRWTNTEYRNRIIAVHTGAIRSQETKKKISDKAIERTKRPGMLAKMCLVHPFRKRVSIAGVIYESMHAAAKVFNIDINTVKNRILNMSDKYKDWSFI